MITDEPVATIRSISGDRDLRATVFPSAVALSLVASWTPAPGVVGYSFLDSGVFPLDEARELAEWILANTPAPSQEPR